MRISFDESHTYAVTFYGYEKEYDLEIDLGITNMVLKEVHLDGTLSVNFFGFVEYGKRFMTFLLAHKQMLLKGRYQCPFLFPSKCNVRFLYNSGYFILLILSYFSSLTKHVIVQLRCIFPTD